jgi:hypothetical protein
MQESAKPQDLDNEMVQQIEEQKKEDAANAQANRVAAGDLHHLPRDTLTAMIH